MIVPIGDVCWRSVMGQESACPETSHWTVMQTAVEEDRLVLSLFTIFDRVKGKVFTVIDPDFQGL